MARSSTGPTPTFTSRTHVIHYGRGLRGRALLQDAERIGVLPPRRAHAPAVRLGADLPHGLRASIPTTITQAVVDTVSANGLDACYIRPLIYRGYHTLGVNPLPCPVDAAILVWEWGAYLGPDALERGVDVRVSSWTRSAPNTFPAMAKSVANYANSSLIKMEAVLDGYSEGIALDADGHVSEGSGQNLFLVRDEMLYTPPLSASVLPGITRDSDHHARAGSRASR